MIFNFDISLTSILVCYQLKSLHVSIQMHTLIEKVQANTFEDPTWSWLITHNNQSFCFPFPYPLYHILKLIMLQWNQLSNLVHLLLIASNFSLQNNKLILLGSCQIKIKWVGYIPSPIFSFLGEKFQTIVKELNFFFMNLIFFLIKNIKIKMISQKNITVFPPIFYTWFK